jgi:hypothetical protein
MSTQDVISTRVPGVDEDELDEDELELKELQKLADELKEYLGSRPS